MLWVCLCSVLLSNFEELITGPAEKNKINIRFKLFKDKINLTEIHQNAVIILRTELLSQSLRAERDAFSQ